jgi:hypothetical protein
LKENVIVHGPNYLLSSLTFYPPYLFLFSLFPAFLPLIERRQRKGAGLKIKRKKEVRVKAV